MINNTNIIQELKAVKKDMITSNSDIFISITGDERAGKSTLGLNILKIFEPDFEPKNLKTRVSSTLSQFAWMAPALPKYKTLIVDEGLFFNRREAYSGKNKALLEYLSEAGGQNRIYLWLYPEITEIDKKVISRSKIFFECVHKNGKYYVHAWNPAQINIILRNRRLTRQYQDQRLDPGDPIIFTHDMIGIEEINRIYLEIKESSLELTDEKLKEFSYTNISKVAIELQKKLLKITGKSYSSNYLRRKVSKAIEETLSKKLVDEYEIFKGSKDTIIKTNEAKRAILKQSRLYFTR